MSGSWSDALVSLAALTRAKKLVVVVGPERAIQTAVSEAEGSVRLSSLQPRLVSQAELLSVARKEPLRFGNQPPPHPACYGGLHRVPFQQRSGLRGGRGGRDDYALSCALQCC